MKEEVQEELVNVEVQEEMAEEILALTTETQEEMAEEDQVEEVEKCIQQHVINVVQIASFHLNQHKENQFFAQIVLEKKVLQDQITLV